MQESIIETKSFQFAIRIVKLYQYLCEEKREYILSKQLVRCGTSIGANVSEAQRGQSKPDFYAKIAISLKEANETRYWIRLLHATEYLSDRVSTLHSVIWRPATTFSIPMLRWASSL